MAMVRQARSRETRAEVPSPLLAIVVILLLFVILNSLQSLHKFR
jgi:hypothetical protein